MLTLILEQNHTNVGVVQVLLLLQVRKVISSYNIKYLFLFSFLRNDSFLFKYFNKYMY